MKELELAFATGSDVLQAYWGHLKSGGLAVAFGTAGIEGSDSDDERVCLTVTVASSGKSYRLLARRCGQDSNGREVFEFEPGQPTDLLVSDALAETDKVPARSATRYPVRVEANIRTSESAPPIAVTIVNVSVGGICFDVEDGAGHRLGVGTVVLIRCHEQDLRGEIRWVSHKSRGVRLVCDGAALQQLLVGKSV